MEAMRKIVSVAIAAPDQRHGSRDDAFVDVRLQRIANTLQPLG
jgi:hypothetical protein